MTRLPVPVSHRLRAGFGRASWLGVDVYVNMLGMSVMIAVFGSPLKDGCVSVRSEYQLVWQSSLEH